VKFYHAGSKDEANAMKLREIVLAAIGAALLVAGARHIRRMPLEISQTTLVGACRTPATVLQSRDAKLHDAVIIFHGLTANRRIMLTLGEELAQAGKRVFLLDFPGHGDSTDSFSFAHAEACAADAIGTLVRRGEINPDNTVLVGHSFGAGIAIRLADIFPAAATIAISPGPLVLPRRMPSNLLVFSAQFDLPILKRAAEQIAQAARGERTQASDFAERRAFQLIREPRATHTSLLDDLGVAERSVLWIHQATTSASESPEEVAWYPQFGFDWPNWAGEAAFGSVLGLAGLLLIFPLAASAFAAAFGFRAAGSLAGAHTPGDAREGTSISPARSGLHEEDQAGLRMTAGAAMIRWTVAAFIAVGVLNFAVPLHPVVRMMTGDYLASLLLLAAAILWALDWKQLKSALVCNPRALAAAIVLGLATFLAMGAWLNWQMTDLWMNAPRWWRFAVILPLVWPYFFAEEIALGPSPLARADRAARFGLFLFLRLILWLACMFALFVMRNQQILILLLVTYMAAFSILQRLGSDALRRRTGSAAAAATFDAILAAWFVAAVFPLT
jgi:alpha-beta hydrolase superfamily lysophospholipase